jgi:hypothetical protein
VSAYCRPEGVVVDIAGTGGAAGVAVSVEAQPARESSAAAHAIMIAVRLR